MKQADEHGLGRTRSVRSQYRTVVRFPQLFLRWLAGSPRSRSFSVFNGKNNMVVSVIDIVESMVEGHVAILYRLLLTYYPPQ
jgi:hypothetical protein